MTHADDIPSPAQARLLENVEAGRGGRPGLWRTWAVCERCRWVVMRFEGGQSEWAVKFYKTHLTPAGAAALARFRERAQAKARS